MATAFNPERFRELARKVYAGNFTDDEGREYVNLSISAIATGPVIAPLGNQWAWAAGRVARSTAQDAATAEDAVRRGGSRARAADAQRIAEYARVAAVAVDGETAVAAVAAVAPAAPRVDCMEVHRVSATFKDKLPLVAVVIREYLGEVTKYNSFIEHLDATIGNYVDSPVFNSKKTPNSGKERKRGEWLTDYKRVRARLTSALVSMSPDLIQLLGDILDFVFKTNLQECYVPNFIYDTAHAYEGEGRANESSCSAGATERVYTTLFNCMKGMNTGVFRDLNRILGEVSSWEELDKSTQAQYQQDFNRFLLQWAHANLENEEVKKMKAEERNEAVLVAFKASRQLALPPFVEGFFRTQLSEGSKYLWQDYGFNSENSPNTGGSQGGRRTRHKKRRKTKIRKTKNKKKFLRRR
jgi:hypothetical protein